MTLKRNINPYSIFTFLLLTSVVFSETFLFNTSLVYLSLIWFFLLINLSKLKFNNFEIISLLLLLTYLTLVIILAKDPIGILNNFKYYFSFIFFIMFFKIYPIDKNFIKYLKLILIACTIFVFLDAAIINFFPLIELHQEIHTAKFFGFYKRPPGFAGNSSISSIFILFAYLVLIKVYAVKFKKIEHLLIYLSIFLLFSSTGFTLMTITFFLLNYEHGKLSSYAMLLFFGVFIFLLFFITKNINVDFAQKISLKYFYYIFQEKIFYINNFYLSREFIISSHQDLYFMEKFINFFFDYEKSSFINFFPRFFGAQLYDSEPHTSGDIGIMGIMEIIGLFGTFCILTIIIAFSKYFKNNFLYILLIIFISLHYGFIFTNVGNLIFAIILTNNLRSHNKYKIIND
jgi:hypothetical protein